MINDEHFRQHELDKPESLITVQIYSYLHANWINITMYNWRDMYKAIKEQLNYEYD